MRASSRKCSHSAFSAGPTLRVSGGAYEHEKVRESTRAGPGLARWYHIHAIFHNSRKAQNPFGSGQEAEEIWL